MKELSIEEKAKRYDEILARAEGANIEVDLEKGIDDYVNEHFSECDDGVLISDANSTELTLLDVTSMARHFFALGLSASNHTTAKDRGMAEERALEAYPVVMTTLIPADNEHPLIEQDCNKFTREAYIKGYLQAEKDLALTWKDVARLFVTASTITRENTTPMTDKAFYQEVLKRFNEMKRNQ